MKETKKCSLLFLLLPSIVLSVAYLSVSVDARRYEGRSRAHNHQKHRGRSKNNKKILEPDHFYSFAPAPAPYYGSYEPHLAIFDVLSFGAKGDGVSNDSKAFLAAWKAACKVPWATVEVPSEFKFLSGQSHSKALVCPTLFSRGGSGHEPDHAGYLGEEMVTAAICGDVFAYPSIDSILAVWVLAS